MKSIDNQLQLYGNYTDDNVFEERLWKSAEKLRGNIDSSQYKYILLGIVFLKFISISNINEFKNGHLYWSKIISSINKNSLISEIQKIYKQLEIDNKILEGISLTFFPDINIDSNRLSNIIEIIDSINIDNERYRDIFGKIYEYFLLNFSINDAKRSGEYYTPQCVVKLLVKMLCPSNGKVYDPCCGTGGMFIQSDYINKQNTKSELKFYGQEFNANTRRLALINLLIHNIKGNLGNQSADTFFEDLHHNLKANYILSNPPFNQKEWTDDRLLNYKKWPFGVPPQNNANYAWIQHIINHLSDSGIAGFILSNGSLSGISKDELTIRKNIIENDLIDCIVSLPSHLFYSTQIPVSLWIINKKKCNPNKVLFINAYKNGSMLDKTHKILVDNEIETISNYYLSWNDGKTYNDISGIVKSVDIEEIRKHKYALVPGRYVGFQKYHQDKFNFGNNELQIIEDLLKNINKNSTLAVRVIKELING